MSNGQSIASNPALGRHAQALTRLGYRTVEEVAGASAAAADAMMAYLGEDVAAALPQLPYTGITAEHDFPLGVALDQIPQPTIAYAMPPPAAAPLPASANLVAQMPAIRDQAHRGTCVAHAALAAVENLRTAQSVFLDMSEQFLYWDCKQNDGIPAISGTYIGVAMPLLVNDGCCGESAWPYVGTPIPGNESQDPPPAGAKAQALSHRIARFNQLSPTSVLDIKVELVRGRCVAFSIPVFNSWYQNAAVRASGDIVLPFPGEAFNGGHAMCICGYQDDPAEEPIGGGRFILRNSWDSAWGTASPHGVGFGTIPYAYIARFGREAYSIE